MKTSIKTNKDILKSPFLTLPSAVLLLLMVAFPLLYLIVCSFATGRLTAVLPGNFSLQNYIKLFSTDVFSKLMVRSLLIGLEVTLICLAVSFPAAWALAKAVKPKNRNLLVILILVPFFISQLLLIYAIMVLFQANGVLMSLLATLKLAAASNTIVYTKTCVVLVLVYEYLPYMILSIYSSLEQLDDSQIYASHTLGAGKFKTFISVVLPETMPGITTGIVLVFIPVVGSFVEPNIVGGPNGMMVGSLIDSQVSMSSNMCYGAAISLVFLLILLIIVVAARLISSIINKLKGGGVSE